MTVTTVRSTYRTLEEAQAAFALVPDREKREDRAALMHPAVAELMGYGSGAEYVIVRHEVRRD